jgi:hypothetical protein
LINDFIVWAYCEENFLSEDVPEKDSIAESLGDGGNDLNQQLA